MGAIAGFWRLDGAPARDEHLSVMLQPMARRGPDGIFQQVSGSSALGAVHSATTPQARGVSWPITHAESGCQIVADARLDYRDDLIAKVDARADASDGELVLQAYLRWGPHCPSHLEGDFAFVIHDPRENRMFGARDPVGMRRLAYAHFPSRFFGFATDPLALATHPSIPAELDEAFIADALDQQEGFDRTSTAFKSIFRLPPAHAMIVSPDGLKTWQYWEIEPSEPLTLSSDEAYAEALREALLGAVETRLRCDGPAGSMLSGGMDSGSICAVAAHLLEREGRGKLVTISATTDDPDCVESATIKLSQGLDNIDPHTIPLEQPEEYADEMAQQRLNMLDDPFDGQMAALRAVYAAAHGAGLKMLLDGALGDLTVGPQDVPLWHIRQGRPLAAWREIEQERWVYRMDEPAFPEMRRKVMTALLPRTMNDARSERSYRIRARALADQSVIDPDLARSVDMADRRVRYQRMIDAHLQSPLGDRRAKMLHPFAACARERYDRVAGANGIEPSDPFADTRLMVLLSRFPVDQFQADGWHKVVLRRAMKGWLPDQVIWRRGKEHIGYRFNQIFQFAGARERSDILDDLASFVRADDLKATKTRLQKGTGGESDATLYHLALWLQRVKSLAAQGSDT